MKRKIFILLVSLTVLLVALTACGTTCKVSAD